MSFQKHAETMHIFWKSTAGSMTNRMFVTYAREAFLMTIVLLERKLQDLLNSHTTLLWLEGAKTDQIEDAKIYSKKLILLLANGTTKIIPFERFSVTKVGLQFWNKGRAGVLYRWDAITKSTGSREYGSCLEKQNDHDFNTPPYFVA